MSYEDSEGTSRSLSDVSSILDLEEMEDGNSRSLYTQRFFDSKPGCLTYAKVAAKKIGKGIMYATPPVLAGAGMGVSLVLTGTLALVPAAISSTGTTLLIGFLEYCCAAQYWGNNSDVSSTNNSISSRGYTRIDKDEYDVIKGDDDLDNSNQSWKSPF